MSSICSRVFILGLDGAGNFVREAKTPNLDSIFSRGAVTYAGRCPFPSISGQCWGSLFHGVGPEKHGLTNDVVSSRPYPEDSPYPSFMKLARQAWPEADLASFSGWGPINAGIIERSAECHLVSRPDALLVPEIVEYIRTHGRAIKLLFVQLDAPDGAGHSYGYGTPEQLEAIHTADAQIGAILNAIEETGLMEDSLIISCSDHGGGGANPRSHGSDHPMDTTIYWGCAGPGITAGTQIGGGFRLMDTAAVVARALGLKAPAAWEARVPEGLFVN